MTSKAARKRNRQSRITLATPDEIRRRRELAENSRLEREAMERDDAKKADKWGIDQRALVNAIVGPTGPRPSDVQVKRDASGQIRSAWRSNPFKLLAESGAISQDEANAAHDLMDIYAASKGMDGAPERTGFAVDGGNPDAWGAEDRKQFNIRLYGMIAAALTEKSAKLAGAFALAVVEEDRPMVWRGIVERELGVSNPERQSERVVMMCEELNKQIPKCREVLRDWLNSKKKSAA